MLATQTCFFLFRNQSRAVLGLAVRDPPKTKNEEGKKQVKTLLILLDQTKDEMKRPVAVWNKSGEHIHPHDRAAHWKSDASNMEMSSPGIGSLAQLSELIRHDVSRDEIQRPDSHTVVSRSRLSQCPFSQKMLISH